MTHDADDSALASFEGKAQVLRRNWAVPLAAVLVALGGIVVERVAPPDAPFGYLAAFMGLVFAAITVKRNAFPRARPATVSASRAALTVGEAAPIPVDGIAWAKIVPHPNGDATVTLTLRGGASRSLRMRAADAATLVRVLGISAGARRTSFALMIPFRARFLVVFLVLGVPWLIVSGRWDNEDALFFLVLTLCWAVAPVCAFLAWIAGLWRGRLIVGADGFSLKWFFRERFVAFPDVVTVRGVARWSNRFAIDTLVELRSGRSLRLRAPDDPVTDEQRGEEARALHQHFVEAREHAAQRPVEVANVSALLGAGSRSGAEWLAHLDELVHGGAARYRVAAPDPERLAEIANDAASPAEIRIGAAAALVRLDEDGRQAVRVAADACVEPKLRAVLVSLGEAQGDDAFAEVLARAARAKG